MTHSKSRLLKYAPILAGLLVLLILNFPTTSMLTATPIRIRLGTLAPQGSSIEKALMAMGQEWRAASNGEVNLVVQLNSGKGGEKEIVDNLEINKLQAAMLTVTGLAEIDRSVTAIEDIPMAFRSLDEVTYVRRHMLESLQTEFRKHKMELLFLGDTGWVRFFTKADAVHPAEFKPMNMFTWAGNPEQEEIMKSAGFHPVVRETTDIYVGLKTGTIDAVPSIPLAVLPGLYYQVCNHMLELNWAPLVGGLVIRKDTWDGLNAATRAALTKAALETEIQVTSDARQENDNAVATMKGLGLKVRTVTPQLEAEWRQFAEGLYPKIKGHMVPEDRFNEVQNLLADFRKAGGNRK